MTDEAMQKVRDELAACCDPLPTASEVIELFERFTYALHTIHEHVEELNYPASCGEMTEEVEAVDKLIWTTARGVAGEARGRVVREGGSVAAHATALVTQITSAGAIASCSQESTLDAWRWGR